MELSEDSLEYISIVARRFCNLAIVDPEMQSYHEDCAITHATELFKTRYAAFLKEDKIESFKLYMQSNALQESLSAHGLDPLKFWYLFLFVDDIAQMCFNYKTVKAEGTAQDEASKLLSILPTVYDTKTNIVLVQISYKDQAIAVSNPYLLHYLRCMLTKIVNNPQDYNGKSIKEEIEHDSRLQYKAQFMKMVLSYLIDNVSSRRTPSKLDIIGRMAYLAGYSKDSSLWKGYVTGDIVPSEREQNSKHKYKLKRGEFIEVHGKMKFIDSINIGKRFSDYIKTKIQISPDWYACDYCYDPYLQSKINYTD